MEVSIKVDLANPTKFQGALLFSVLSHVFLRDLGGSKLIQAEQNLHRRERRENRRVAESLVLMPLPEPPSKPSESFPSTVQTTIPLWFHPMDLLLSG